jgi:hypothetical protein
MVSLTLRPLYPRGGWVWTTQETNLDASGGSNAIIREEFCALSQFSPRSREVWWLFFRRAGRFLQLLNFALKAIVLYELDLMISVTNIAENFVEQPALVVKELGVIIARDNACKVYFIVFVRVCMLSWDPSGKSENESTTRDHF